MTRQVSSIARGLLAAQFTPCGTTQRSPSFHVSMLQLVLHTAVDIPDKELYEVQSPCPHNPGCIFSLPTLVDISRSSISSPQREPSLLLSGATPQQVRPCSQLQYSITTASTQLRFTCRQPSRLHQQSLPYRPCRRKRVPCSPTCSWCLSKLQLPCSWTLKRLLQPQPVHEWQARRTAGTALDTAQAG